MRTQAGHNLFFLFPFGHFFLPFFFLKVRLFLALPGVSLCSYNQRLMVHRDRREWNNGNLLNIQIIFPVFKTGDGWHRVGKKTENLFFFWSKDKWSCFPCVENGMDVMMNFRFFSLFIFDTSLGQNESVRPISMIRTYNLSYFFYPGILCYHSEVALPVGSSFSWHNVFLFWRDHENNLMKSKQMPLNAESDAAWRARLCLVLLLFSLFFFLLLKSQADVLTAGTFVESFQSLLSCRLFFELLTGSLPTITHRWQQSQRSHATISISAKV